ncbi:hypothetical protein BDD12DRAFT_809338 [Trichophaea hybrida]|nr:hypothetical protein BDD12DRAFT_809338 [Trichophaea hybrida]
MGFLFGFFCEKIHGRRVHPGSRWHRSDDLVGKFLLMLEETIDTDYCTERHRGTVRRGFITCLAHSWAFDIGKYRLKGTGKIYNCLLNPLYEECGLPLTVLARQEKLNATMFSLKTARNKISRIHKLHMAEQQRHRENPGIITDLRTKNLQFLRSGIWRG